MDINYKQLCTIRTAISIAKGKLHTVPDTDGITEDDLLQLEGYINIIIEREQNKQEEI